jgi:hypothetical protein
MSISRRKNLWVATTPVQIAFWISALLLYGLGDLLTTTAVLAAGGRELNPLLAAAALTFGGSLLGPVIVKIVTLGCLAAIYLTRCASHRWAIPVLLTLVGLGLVLNNILAGTGL